MSVDPIDPLETERRANRVLAERVADLERQLERISERPDSATALGGSLAEREALLSEAERIAHMGSWVWNVATDEVLWSNEFYRIFGYDPELDSASFDGFFTRIHPDDLLRVRETAARSVAAGVNERLHFRVLRPDNSVRHVMLDAVFLFDAAGNMQRAVGTALDITDQHEAAKRLEHSASLLAEAQRIGKMGSFDFDVVTQAATWSDELYKLIDVDPSQTPTVELFVQRLHPDDRVHMTQLIEASLTNGNTQPSRARVVWRDGSLHHLNMMAAVTRDPAGRLLAIRGTVSDVTELVKLEALFHQSQKMNAIGQLAGGLAHDYNNLLMVISGNAELIAERFDCREAHEIMQAARSATDLTNRLLTFSRPTPLSLKSVKLADELTATRPLIQQALGDNIELTIDVAAHIWPLFVDSGQVQQVLLNLALNARDAMPDGGRLALVARNETLSANGLQHPESLAGDFVVLRVSDTGTGMDEDTRARAFDPFFTTKPLGRGTGLGLTMVFSSMKQCGGRVELHSEPGAGTTFTLCFRRAPTTPERVARSPQTSMRGSARVLLVEDNVQVAHVTRLILETSGYEVCSTDDPYEALRLWQQKPFDLLVTDIEMPRMSGTRLCEQLRAKTPALRTLFITGHSNKQVELGSEPGRTQLLAKPFRRQQLLIAVQTLLSQ